MLRIGLFTLGLMMMAWVPGASAQAPVPCPEGLAATSHPDGTVDLVWQAVPEADGYNVFRQERNFGFLFRGHLNASTTTFFDGDPKTIGATYTYLVHATLGSDTSSGCDQVQVVGVPELGSVLALGLAAVGGVGAFVLARKGRGRP